MEQTYWQKRNRKINQNLVEKEELYEKGLKKCTKCGEIKNISEFGPQKAGWMGLQAKCRSCCNEYDKQYQIKTGVRVKRDQTPSAKQYREDYRNSHKDKAREYDREWKSQKYKDDNFFRIKHNISCRLSKAISKKWLSVNTKELMGCDRETFMKHLESQFRDGMSWENYGKNGWHVDHILPLISFNMLDINEVKKACHYTNLQPLWWWENLEKGTKIL
jgi:hypothetical protein